jgi:hypothetical protein
MTAKHILTRSSFRRYQKEKVLHGTDGAIVLVLAGVVAAIAISTTTYAAIVLLR